MGLKSSINPAVGAEVRCLPKPGFGTTFLASSPRSNLSMGEKRGEKTRKCSKPILTSVLVEYWPLERRVDRAVRGVFHLGNHNNRRKV